jgi:hypothetical protein
MTLLLKYIMKCSNTIYNGTDHEDNSNESYIIITKRTTLYNYNLNEPEKKELLIEPTNSIESN